MRFAIRLFSAALVAALLLGLMAYPALAAEAAAGNGATGSGRAEALLIAQVLLLMVVGRLLGEGLQRFGQPPLVGQLLAGLILGPSLLGAVWPAAQHFLFPADSAQQGMIGGLSQIGILLLLLLTGMETDLKLVRKAKAAAIAVSITGVAVPFFGGFLLGQVLPDSLLPPGLQGRLVPSLFLGTALAISSVKIVAMVVREMNFMRRNLGQVIVASAIIEDTVGWVIIAITFGIAGQQHLSLLSLVQTVAGVALFLIFSFTIGRRIVFAVIRWANDNFHSEFPVITAILAVMGVMALMTQALGVHTVLGAFIAGVLIGESPILTAHIQGQLRGLIAAFFMPVFFGMSGLSADLTVIVRQPQLLMFTGVIIVIASLGKFLGAFAGAKMGGLRFKEGVALGCAMNARGSTEVVVASIGLSIGALTQNLYTMIVTMAMVTTLAMPPMLRAALRRLPMRQDEQTRIAREEMDETGFLPRLERLLLAVDASAVGQFTARLAGLVAGAQGMPVTILNLREEADAAAAPLQGPVANEVKSGAKQAASKVIADEHEPNPEKVHLTERAQAPQQTQPNDAIREEIRKGYDMLLIGAAECCDADGGFTPLVSRLAREFTGNIAVLAPGDGALPVLRQGARLLVAVNGTEMSRNAAELAFAIARATGASVTAVYAATGDRKRRTRAREEELLKDIARLAERYDVRLRTSIAGNRNAAQAILQEAARHSLIVMGVSVRPGEDLFFGNTATEVMTGARKPVLFLANKPADIAPPRETVDSAVA